METRNLIKFGKNSFVVTIPISWIKKNNLEKGNSIFITPASNGLLISPSVTSNVEEKKCTINTEGKDLDSVFREIVVAYVNNSKIIEVKGEELRDNSDIVCTFLQSFMSLEILEQTSNKIMVRDFLRFEDISIITITKRIDNIIRVMLKDCLQSIDEDFSDSLSQRDRSINRLYYLIFRMTRASIQDPQIANQTDMNSVELLDHWGVTQSLESMGDECKRLARGLKDIENKKDKKDILTFLEKIEILYRDSMKAYYNKNKIRANKLNEKLKELWRDLDEVASNHKNTKVSYLAAIFLAFIVEIRTINRINLNRE